MAKKLLGLNGLSVNSSSQTKINYGNFLSVTGLVIDSTKWYRILTLPASYCSYVELIIQIPQGHSVYKVKLSKATGGNGIGWTASIDLGGIYNYTIGNIVQFRVVDIGPNAEVHVDIKFNGNATRDIRISLVNEVTSTTGVSSTLVPCTDQGITSIGKVCNLSNFSDVAALNSINSIMSPYGVSQLYTSASAIYNRCILDSVDFISGAQTDGGVVGTRSNHQLNFMVNNVTKAYMTNSGDFVIPSNSANFGTTTRQMINLFSSNYGIGVQSNTQYFRSGGTFSYHINGVHSDSANDPGTGGTEIVRVDAAGIHIGPTNSGNSSNGWFRSYGNTGWYNGTYGGGWHQNDSTFIKNYGSKSVAISKNFDSVYGNLHLTGTSPTISFWDTDDSAKWILHSNGGSMYFFKSATNAETAGDWVLKCQIKSDGNILLSGLSGTGNRAVYADSSGNLVLTASDSRLKKNIKPIHYGLNAIMSLNPITYQWKDQNRGNQVELGLVADDVLKIIPELVGTTKDKYLTMDYARLTPILIEALKELKNDSDKLKKEHEDLKRIVYAYLNLKPKC